MKAAHRVGLRSTSTVMYGHIEEPRPRGAPPRPPARDPEGDGRLHRVRAARLHPREERALQPPRRPARREHSRGPAARRRRAALPAAVDHERPGLVGQDGPEARPGGAHVRRERFRRHADGGVDQPRVGLAARREPAGRGDAAPDPRHRPRARRAEHDLQRAPPLRRPRAGPALPRAEGRAPALRSDPLAGSEPDATASARAGRKRSSA